MRFENYPYGNTHRWIEVERLGWRRWRWVYVDADAGGERLPGGEHKTPRAAIAEGRRFLDDCDHLADQIKTLCEPTVRLMYLPENSSLAHPWVAMLGDDWGKGPWLSADTPLDALQGLGRLVAEPGVFHVTVPLQAQIDYLGKRLDTLEGREAEEARP